MFEGINLTNQAIKGQSLRMEILSGNVAQADTPGYKRMDVAFNHVLEEQIAGGETNLEPEVYVDRIQYSNRLDGNNVDIEYEMSEIAKTKLRYDTLVQRATAQLGRYKSIFQNIK